MFYEHIDAKKKSVFLARRLLQMKFKMIEVTDDKNEDNSWDEDRNLPIVFNKRRHTQKIEGIDSLTQSWRMKDRVSLKKM